MPVAAKICGLTDASAVATAVEHGARFTGFIFFPPSPRNVTPSTAAELAQPIPADVTKVGVFVDPDDARLADTLAAVPLDLLQLHGDETPARLQAIKARFGLPVMKVIKVGTADDLAPAAGYMEVADRLMFDTRPPPDADRPGGNAESFDWSILSGQSWPKPWFLAGGITADNVATAVATTGAQLVDISSGVEHSPGRKDPAKIKAFLDITGRL